MNKDEQEEKIDGISLREANERSRRSENIRKIVLHTIRRSGENVKNSEQQAIVSNLIKTIENDGLFDIQKVYFEYKSVQGKDVIQLERGFESKVYLLEDNGNRKIIKITNWESMKGISNTYMLNPTIIDFIQNKVVAQKKLFPETDYKVIGIDVDFQFVLEQPYIESLLEENGKPKMDEIENDLIKRGFSRANGSFGKFHAFWIDDENDYVVFDIRPANVLKGSNNKLFYIDPIIQPNTEIFRKVANIKRTKK